MITVEHETQPRNGCECDENQLRLFPCLSVVSDDAVVAIARKSFVKRYWRGDVLFKASDKAKFFFIVERGAIQLHNNSEDAREVEIRVLTEGNFYCGTPTCARNDNTVNALAVEDTSVIAIPRDDFVSVIHSGLTEFGIEVLTMACTRVKQLSTMMRSIERHSC
ncbi:Crp/Fnr family transcriptional regulator [Candidatus Magnetominusculus xianensis]|uniref:Crp/FNR family transcriptional regulator n=1 Tax=Candidatus Magnetominusculus xianensis TaxID=1748249 RepID=A0ABR5SF02_9BACT|nr:Crp/Fnr family transcriptional regulator [Candidatus Magnetominusculus xianensis]KWT76811.1 Crp/FNR family transcriptional regulator [Candidatus Magnetominusculus xianensis]MBF0402683.1 Crp/Fnr family transcriptional regulator [Nitrospirota bacterium]